MSSDLNSTVPGRLVALQAETLARLVAQRLGRLLRQYRPGRSLGVIFLAAALWAGYVLTGRPVTVVVQGQPYPLRSHAATVGDLLQEMGLTPAGPDIIQPAPDTRLAPGMAVSVRLARPVTVEADGRSLHFLTQAQMVAEVLAEAGVAIQPRDEILLNTGGKLAPAGTALPASRPAQAGPQVARLLLARFTPAGALAAARPEMVRLIIHRAVPVTLYDGQASSTFYTTRPTVGEALLEQGLVVYLGDRVTPGLSTPLSPGVRVYIQRSTPVTFMVDGRLMRTRTRRNTVGEVLAQEGVVLMGQDYSRPPASAALAAGTRVEVVRVQESLEVEQELIPFETSWVPDEAMELDRQEVRQPGVTGVIKTRTRVRTENGQEVWRGQEDRWLDQEPSNRIIAYGTRIVVRTLDTPDGPLEYWRKISMLTTPYNAASSGKEPDHPRYGITRSGLRVGYGMAAVDPKVIPLQTRLYVPGYGQAVAADTGGLILGKHIDLAFDDNQSLPDLYGWQDVYILTPVPPAGEIRYVLPEWPQR